MTRLGNPASAYVVRIACDSVMMLNYFKNQDKVRGIPSKSPLDLLHYSEPSHDNGGAGICRDLVLATLRKSKIVRDLGRMTSPQCRQAPTFIAFVRCDMCRYSEGSHCFEILTLMATGVYLAIELPISSTLVELV